VMTRSVVWLVVMRRLVRVVIRGRVVLVYSFVDSFCSKIITRSRSALRGFATSQAFNTFDFELFLCRSSFWCCYVATVICHNIRLALNHQGNVNSEQIKKVTILHFLGLPISFAASLISSLYKKIYISTIIM
jgi:hypothetical protein